MQSPSTYCDWLVNEEGKGLYFNDLCNTHRIEEYQDYAMNSPAAQIAKQATNSKVFFVESFSFSGIC